jgi:hypothetical protein
MEKLHSSAGCKLNDKWVAKKGKKEKPPYTSKRAFQFATVRKIAS